MKITDLNILIKSNEEKIKNLNKKNSELENILSNNSNAFDDL